MATSREKKDQRQRSVNKRTRTVEGDAAKQIISIPFDGAADPTPEADSDWKLRDLLAARIEEDIRESTNARQASGIEEVWSEAMELYAGKNSRRTPRVKTRDQVPRSAGDSGSTFSLNIVRPKTDVAGSRVSEMLVPTDDQPWDIEPTPVPELDPKKIDASQTVQLGDGNVASAQAVAMMAADDARKKCEKAKDWISDRFTEANVYPEMRQQIKDADRIGTGVLKGPVPEMRYVGNENRTTWVSKCVRAADCFPDPSCGDDIHKGAYFIERDFITGKALRDMAELPEYDAMSIALALSEGPSTFAKSRGNSLASAMPRDGNTDNDAKLYEIFYWYGELRPADMLLLGMNAEKKLQMPADHEDYDPNLPPDQQLLDEIDPESYGGLTELELQLYKLPAIVTMLNGRAIKATVNPQDGGCFPYDFFVWDQVEGQPWGRGVPTKLEPAQRMLDANVRALLKNGGLSSGPQIAINRKALTPANGDYALRGSKLWFHESDEFQDDVRKAIGVFEIPSVQQELMGNIEFAMNMADRLTNLPMLMQGDQQAGSSPETLGGMRMLLNNAMSPLRDIAKYHDDHVTKPHLRRWYELLMRIGPEDAKGDYQISAKGSTVLVQREEGRIFLAQIAAMVPDPRYKINPEKWIAEMGRSNGYDMTRVQYSEDEWAKVQQEAAANPPPPPPQVQAAQINAQANQKRAEAQAQADMATVQARTEAEAADRQLRVEELRLQRELKMAEVQLQMLTLATTKDISLEKIKAQLAETAMGNSMERDALAWKMDPRNKPQTGIPGGIGDHND